MNCIVLSTQRSGSTFLVNYLSSGRGIRIHSELFQRLDKRYEPSKSPKHYGISYERYRTASLGRRLRHVFARRRLITEYLEQIFAPDPELKVIGFKLMYNQIRKYPDVFPWLVNRDIRIIHMIRENALQMMVSRELARARGTHAMVKPLAPVKVKLDVNKLLDRLARNDEDVHRHREICRTLKHVELTYESFFADIGGATRLLLDFLGVRDGLELSSALVKTNPHAMEDTIENYDEVARALEHTKFATFLN